MHMQLLTMQKREIFKSLEQSQYMESTKRPWKSKPVHVLTLYIKPTDRKKAEHEC
jgi:hypothetical protein